MAHFPDLSHYVYGRTHPEPHILNIGWLSNEHKFPQGTPPEWLALRLEERISSPVNQYRGSHNCEFCPPPPKRKLESGFEMAFGGDTRYRTHCCLSPMTVFGWSDRSVTWPFQRY